MTESVPTQTRDDETVALAVGAGGALALILGMLVDSGVLRVVGFVAAVAGGGLYARKRLAERSEKIDEAESDIRADLDELDPVAQAQVLKGLADAES